jgi:GNAT superfamily N-acetyltransferase
MRRERQLEPEVPARGPTWNAALTVTDPGLRLTLEAADTDASRELQRSFFADIASRYAGWDPDLGPSADPSELGPPGGAWMVAYLDGRPVSCGGFKSVDDDVAEVRRVFVDESARGLGIGRRLLEELEEHARRLGYRRLRLNTGDRQPEALGLFRAAGFVEVEDFNGYVFAYHWMQKEI